MQRPITLAEAQERLPEIGKRLNQAPHFVEYISDPGLPVDLAITTRSHIRYLEVMAKRLDDLTEPFVLAGSITLNGSDDEIERDLAADRAEQNALFEAKLRSFSE
jgi:hypothetical protein